MAKSSNSPAINAARAIAYARVSTEEQGRGYSLDTQLTAIRRYCDDQGYTVVAEYTDQFSGTEIDRPGVTALLDALPTIRPNVVVLFDVDRLGRELVVQAILEREMTSTGAQIEYVLGGATNTPEGELLKMMKGAIAVFENRQRVERSRRGKVGRVKAGYPIVAARPPFGYRYVSTERHKGELVIDEAEAAVVREMYQWLTIERLSSYEIAKRLWERGVPTRADVDPVVTKRSSHAEWSPGTIRRILENSLYKGDWYYGKTRRQKLNGRVTYRKIDPSQWVHVAVPAIIDAETWEDAQRCLTENKANAVRNTRHDYLLRSMVFCSCGRRWTGRWKSNQHGHPHAYYRCPTHESEPWRAACPARFSIRADILEPAVWDYVIDELLHPDRLLADVERRIAEASAETELRDRRLAAVDGEIAAIDRKLGQLLSQELDGYPAALIEREMRRLLEHRRDLVTERDRLGTERVEQGMTPDVALMVAELAETVEQAAPNMTFDERRQLLTLLRVRVDVIDRTHVHVSGLVNGSAVALSSR